MNSLSPTPQPTQSVFREPESILWDGNREVYWVSNMNGMSKEKDANGFITIVSPDGKILNPKFISSTKEHPLHSPKGMALQGKKLFVVDLDTLRIYNADTGQHIHSEVIDHAVLLNDIVFAEGDIFMSDLYLDQVVRIDAVNFTIKTTISIEKPNGLFYEQGELSIASFSEEGLIYCFELNSKQLKTIQVPKGYIDGIVKVGNQYLLSSWQYEGLLFEDQKDWGLHETPKGMFADISFDEKHSRILLPVTKEQKILFVSQDMTSIITVY